MVKSRLSQNYGLKQLKKDDQIDIFFPKHLLKSTQESPQLTVYDKPHLTGTITSCPRLSTKTTLSIRKSNHRDGAKFKVTKAFRLARDVGNLLIIEDSPEHALALAKQPQGLNANVILLPFASITLPDVADYEGNNLVVLRRDSKDQNTWPLYEFLSGKSRETYGDS